MCRFVWEGWKSVSTTSRPEYVHTQSQNRHKSCHFHRIIKQYRYIILVKTSFYKIKHTTLMEDYKFLTFFMNDKLYTTDLSFGSHICNQAARIRINNAYWENQLRP